MESLIMEREECYSMTSTNKLDEDEELKALRLACLLTIKKPVQLTEIKPAEASQIQTQTLPIRKNWLNKRRNTISQKSNARSNLIVITPGSDVISCKHEDNVFQNNCQELPKTVERIQSGPSRFSRYESNSSSEDTDTEDHKTAIFGGTNQEISVPKHYELHSGYCSDIQTNWPETCETKSKGKEESGYSSVSFPVPLLCTADASNTKKFESSIASKLCSETSNSRKLFKNYGDKNVTVKENNFLSDPNHGGEPCIMISDSVSSSKHFEMTGARTSISIKKMLTNALEISTHPFGFSENDVKCDVSGSDKSFGLAKSEKCLVSPKSINFEVTKYKTGLPDRDTHFSTDINYYKKRYVTSTELPTNTVSGPSKFSRYESGSSTDESDFERHEHTNQNVQGLSTCAPKKELKNKSSLSKTYNHEKENNSSASQANLLKSDSKETDKLQSLVVADETHDDESIVVNHLEKYTQPLTVTTDFSCNESGYEEIKSFDIHSSSSYCKSDHSSDKFDFFKSDPLSWIRAGSEHESRNNDSVNFQKPITISESWCENLSKVSNNSNLAPLPCNLSGRSCENISEKHEYNLPVSGDKLVLEKVMRNTLKDDDDGTEPLQMLITKGRKNMPNSADNVSNKSDDECMDNFPQKLDTYSTAMSRSKCSKITESVPSVFEKNLKFFSFKSVDSKVKVPSALISCLHDDGHVASVTLGKNEHLLSKNDLRYTLKKKNVQNTCNDSRSALNCVNLQAFESNLVVDLAKRNESEVSNFFQTYTNDPSTFKKSSVHRNSCHKSSNFSLEKKKSIHKKSSQSYKSEIRNRSLISRTSNSGMNSYSNDKKKKRIASVIRPVESSEELKLSDIQGGFNSRKQRLNKKKLNERCEENTEGYVEDLDFRPHIHGRCDSSSLEKKRVPVHLRLGCPSASLKSLSNAWTVDASEEICVTESSQSRIQISGDSTYEKDFFSSKKIKKHYHKYKYPYRNSKCRKHK